LPCIVKDESKNYFSHEAASADGKWKAPVLIGNPTIGHHMVFTLILATATQSTFDEIKNRQQNEAYYNINGLGPNLPFGIEQLAEVVIERVS
jgi:hypothetical protein